MMMLASFNTFCKQFGGDFGKFGAKVIQKVVDGLDEIILISSAQYSL